MTQKNADCPPCPCPPTDEVALEASVSEWLVPEGIQRPGSRTAIQSAIGMPAPPVPGPGDVRAGTGFSVDGSHRSADLRFLVPGMAPVDLRRPGGAAPIGLLESQGGGAGPVRGGSQRPEGAGRGDAQGQAGAAGATGLRPTPTMSQLSQEADPNAHYVELQGTQFADVAGIGWIGTGVSEEGRRALEERARRAAAYARMLAQREEEALKPKDPSGSASHGSPTDTCSARGCCTRGRANASVSNTRGRSRVR